MEFEVNNMATISKSWIDFIGSLTDKSKDLLLIEMGLQIEKQLGTSGLERRIALYKEQYSLREKRVKK